MKPYKKIEVPEITAAQYGVDDSAQKYVEQCVINNKGKIASTNNGLMSIPKDPFSAVKTSAGYHRINEGDWVIKKGEEILVVTNGVFQLMFAPE